MADVFSNTSVMVVRTRHSLILAVDSRTTGIWGEVNEDDYKKVFPLRSDNVIMCISGNAGLATDVKENCRSEFPSGFPADASLQSIAKQVQKYARNILGRLLRRHNQDNQRKAEILHQSSSTIYIVGFDFETNSCRTLILRHLTGSVATKDLRIFGSVEEDHEGLVFGGSGATAMRKYCHEIRPIQPIELMNMSTEDAMAYAKDAIEYASKHDWFTGGAIHTFAISRGGCQRKTWIPRNPSKSILGYKIAAKTPRGFN